MKERRHPWAGISVVSLVLVSLSLSLFLGDWSERRTFFHLQFPRKVGVKRERGREKPVLVRCRQKSASDAPLRYPRAISQHGFRTVPPFLRQV